MRLGDLELPSNVLYSPLAGCSDYAFRRMAARYGPGLMFCEMVKMDPLCMGKEQTLDILTYSEEMRPIGGQIVGSKVELAGQSAKIIEDLGFDVVDLNCGCPVDKVTKDGSGSGLLKDPEHIGEILSEMVAAVKIPVTVKIRIGWDHELINAPEIVRIAEEAGAKLITIHGRTRKQAYKGLADRGAIAEAVEAADKILVAGNGDIFDPESAVDMFEKTGCDAVMVSRGTMGKPWIAEAIRAHMQGEAVEEKGPHFHLDMLLEHIEEILAVRSGKRAAIDIRRVGCWYCKTSPHIGKLRNSLARVDDATCARELVLNYAKEHLSESDCVGSGAGCELPTNCLEGC